MEYHLSEHINNIHDIFLHGALNLTNLLVTVLSGQVINQLKNQQQKTHTRRNKQNGVQSKWKKRLFTKLALVSKKKNSLPSEKLRISPGCLLRPMKFIMSLFKYAPTLQYVH